MRVSYFIKNIINEKFNHNGSAFWIIVGVKEKRVERLKRKNGMNIFIYFFNNR